ncbi:MAG: hypothetical protein ACRCTZ_09305 [Sarcina sp.]
MEINNLWEVLEYTSDRKDIIREDLKKGLAPNLPYFMVGMDSVKDKLKKEVENIDRSLKFGLIKGQVGNGKSNLLKYLEFYFKSNSQYNIHPTIWRTDIDRFDIILFLLYIIQQEFSDKLLEALLLLKQKDEYKPLCQNFNGTFTVLNEYVDKIIEYASINDRQNISKLIELGTGKVYDKSSFNKFNIEKLTDYNRREILVLFLNVLANQKYYIFFGIDEMEKLQEKSRARFQTFLTSFRELIDLSSLIHGHMILVAATDSIGNSETTTIESYNAAFSRRINQYIYETPRIDKISDIKYLSNLLNEILDTEKSIEEINSISANVFKKNHTRNSDIIIHLCTMLLDSTSQTWNDLLEKYSLKGIFNNKKEELLENDVQLRIHQKFFSPLETYCLLISNSLQDYEIKALQYQSVYNVLTNRCTIFLFNDDIESNLSRIRNVVEKYPSANSFNIMKPYSLDITMATLVKEFNGEHNLEVNNYDPIELMALFEICIEDYLNENWQEIIPKYTKDM